MNETMPISAGLPAGMTTDACLEAQLRSAFLTGETDGEEAGLRPEFVINDPDRRIKVLTVIEDELARCTSFDSLEADGGLCKGAAGRIQGALGPSAQPPPP